MGNINVLSFAVANLIAAGEVVDRPASVVKELLENAIDSGATVITVEIQNGGVTYMRVSDNGCGMEPDDLPVAIRRHATSKIREAKDLDGILTLGFRGEALAAIASVSELRIISKQRGADVGAMLEAHAGNIIGVSERAASDGTTVIVENLFANVPARRKFLKKDITEAMAVSAVVEKIALSMPTVSFKLIVDGNVKLETIGDGNTKNTIYSIFGREFASKLIETSIEIDGIRVEGFIGRPDNVRANRNYQNFFINGRYVKSRTAGAALEQAYTSYIPPEKFPCCVLFLHINPSTVDVNVHPAKLEVKFSNEKPVFEAVYYSVRNALEQNDMRPEIKLSHGGSVSKNEWVPKTLTMANLPIEEGRRESLASKQVKTELYVQPQQIKDTQQASQPQIQKEAEPTFPARRLNYFPTVQKAVQQTDELPAVGLVKEGEPIVEPKADALAAFAEEKEAVIPTLSYRIIGEAFNAYVIVEREDMLLLIDKHAAHERIIFEQLKEGLKGQKAVSQLLMLPIELMMTSEEIHTIEQYRAQIEAIGFEFTTQKYTANITAIPEGISTEVVGDMLVVMAERIKSGTGSAELTRDIIFEKALYQASCKAAIKAGREYSAEHIKWIVQKLMQLPDITVCPHGRPVAMEMSKKSLDRQFERT